MVSVSTTQLCPCSTKATADTMSMMSVATFQQMLFPGIWPEDHIGLFLLCDAPLYKHTTIYLAVLLLMNVWIASRILVKVGTHFSGVYGIPQHGISRSSSSWYD